MTKIKFPFYFHSDKDSNYERAMADEWSLSSEAMVKFLYAGYEIRIDCEVDTDTGQVYAYALEGVALEKPVKI